MKTAREFRASAKYALYGKWGNAVGVGLVAALLGGASGGAIFNYDFSDKDSSGGSLSFGDLSDEAVAAVFLIFGVVFAVALVVGVAYFILGSTVGAGYSRYNLGLIDNKTVGFDTLFSYFPHLGKAVLTNFIRSLYTFLWMLLFIVPGIIAAYNYAMTTYIIAEDPSVSASDALARSKAMMYGNRWRFFCLEISFIGWDLLCALTLGIGYLWLTPYKNAAYADFYREISGTRPVVEMQDGAETTVSTNDQTTEL